ncbi:MAG: putative DNA binding domain-containing protein [Lachnospiraceae bacterium]|nr:putative DNA binding domain-containing protein [Lachnospiraceae bacterium]
MRLETEEIEFKEQFTESVYKEVIAFANTNGGTIYIGIDDEGNAVGIKDVDQEYVRITNGIRDAIMPDVTMFVRYKIQDNQVVQIVVREGTNKPYYLKAKGMRQGGVFVRQGSSSVSASPEAIRQMIKESDGDVYEEKISPVQELTFQGTSEAFRVNDVDFSTSKYAAIGMTVGADAEYTNLGRLLSDQCEHTIRVAVFADEGKRMFRDRQEFGGSVLTQFDQVSKYLDLCNRTAAVVKGYRRVDTRDYPEEAVREALLNAIVHRDYSYSGSSIINIYDSHMEFITLGGLLPGIEKEDICNGISLPRNRKLASVFYRLRLIEAYGTGIFRIMDAYEDCSEKPKFVITPNSFKLILPNRNAVKEKAYSVRETPSEQRYGTNMAPYRTIPVVTEQMRRVLTYIDEYGQITDGEIQQLLSLKKTRAFTIAKRLREFGLIVVEGRGEERRYRRVQ